MINSEEPSVVKGQVVDGLSPGKRLSQGRLQLGLTQEQVAKELYITLVKIKALESDDYGHLNTDTFIRGYIRAYANLLKIDVVEVLAAYDQLLQERGLQSVAQPGAAQSARPGNAVNSNASNGNPSNGNAANSSPAIVSPASKGALQLLLVIAAFFVGLWLISIWFFNHEADENYTALSPVVSLYSSSGESVSSEASVNVTQSSAVRSGEAGPMDSVGVMRTQPPLLLSSSVAALVSASSAKNRTASTSSLPLPAAQSAIISSASAASSLADSAGDKPKPTGLDTISFSFRAECWLEVSDSRGDVLATELQAAGSSLSLVGKAPFDVKLGNAPAVAIELNSKKIDVIPLLGSNVLTLRVSE